MEAPTPPLSSPVICPVDATFQPEQGISSALSPLLIHLTGNVCTEHDTVFPKGTITSSGQLDLCKQSIGPEGAQLVADELLNNTVIRHLLLGTNGIGNEGARNLVPLIEQTTSLQTLYLGCNYIHAPGIASLTQALQTNRSINGLWLKRNPVGKDGARHIAHLIRNTRTLRILDLVNTNLGEQGLKLIMDALLNPNSTIERLYLGGNGITAKGAAWLAEVIVHNRKLTGLLLNANALGGKGAEIIAQALQENTTLTEIGLASNGITETGAIALMEATHHHPGMKVLDLGYSASTRALGAQPNHLTDKVAEALKHAIGSHLGIHTLNLVRHSFTQVGFGYLRQYLEQNATLQNLFIDGNPPADLKALIKTRKNPNALLSDSAVAAIRSVYR